MAEELLLSILIIHFVADFVLQTDKQAKGKSTSMNMLISHTLAYSLVWGVVGVLLYIFNILVFNFPLFVLITFTTHTITDYFTSRWGKIYWDRGNTHMGFIIVGFDQILHYIQLYLTLKFLL